MPCLSVWGWVPQEEHTHMVNAGHSWGPRLGLWSPHAAAQTLRTRCSLWLFGLLAQCARSGDMFVEMLGGVGCLLA